MKILITGMTQTQSGVRPRLDYVSLPCIFRDALILLGHDVELRPVLPEEPITWDIAFIGLTSPLNLVAVHLYPVLDLLARAREGGCRVIFYADDWDVYSLTKAIKSTSCAPDPAYRLITKEWFKGCRKHRDWGLTRVDYLVEIVQRLHTGRWPTLVMPLFEWGDVGVLLDRCRLNVREVITVDPTMMSPMHPVSPWPSELRERRWVNASLSAKSGTAWQDNLGLTWPVTNYGKLSGTRLRESEVAAAYGGSWGVMSQPYNHRGSGWWRVRYLHAARARAILLGAIEDLKPIGPEFVHVPAVIEAMSAAELAELGDAQATRLLSRFWPTERLVTAMNELIS